MRQWEYDIEECVMGYTSQAAHDRKDQLQRKLGYEVSFFATAMLPILQERGQAGWELIQAFTIEINDRRLEVQLVFKRPVTL